MIHWLSSMSLVRKGKGDRFIPRARHALTLPPLPSGRGTSTFDGNAIAYAVTQHLTTEIKCRTLFATHYHTLCEDFATSSTVALGHMDCLVEEDADKGAAGAKVTFLYTLAPGACPKSYGLNIASLARLPASVIARAAEKSAEFERAVIEAEEGVRARAASAAAVAN